MEFYLTNIPGTVNDRQTRAAIRDVFKRYFIYEFEMRQWRNKRNRSVQEGSVTIHDAAIGEEILRRHGITDSRPITRGYRAGMHRNAVNPIIVAGHTIIMRRSNKTEAIPIHLIRALRDGNELTAKRMAERQPEQQKPHRTPFAFQGFECGVWITDPRNPKLPTFSSFYTNPRQGNFRMTRPAIQVEIFKSPGPLGATNGHYMLCPTSTITSSIISQESSGTYFIVSLRWSPKLYQKIEPTDMHSPTFSRRLNKARVSSLDERHSKIVSYCFVYRFKLKEAHESIRLITVGSLPGFKDIQGLTIFHQYASYDFQRSMTGLDEQLASLPFDIAFQLHSFVLNGTLLPHRVKELLGVVRRAIQIVYNKAYLDSQLNPDREDLQGGPLAYATQVVASVLKSWAGSWEPQLPSDDPESWLTENIEKDFLEALEKKQQSQEYMLQMKFYRKENQVLIHRMSITPTGMFPGGPNLEPKNRVLREYQDYLNCFLRVSLVDEDGGDLRFESGVDGKPIYSDRFLPILMPDSQQLRIAGRNFTFLGFSQSSLRTHTAWFLAPVHTPRRTITVDSIINNLGDFKSIKIPGKCAARIGQAFTDTVANIKITDPMTVYKDDIVKVGYDGKKYTFSDGCGTISKALIEKIWKKGGFVQEPKPTVFQIRFKGAKGVVSLDTRLRDPQINLYNSMVKFNGLKNNIFEIGRSFTKPLPFYLNRCIIKILEDRGVPSENFLRLQRNALAALRDMTFTSDSAAYFLESQNRCTQGNIPFLIRELTSLRCDYKEDNFLRKVVEFTMLSTLRDMKYRARIQIDKGYTLVGILDETGFLAEGEIFCPVQSEDGPREVHEGIVAICRNPALHPGDIQVVRAINKIPYDSPLHDLTNCVVFSRRGNRDLPSMLSGGDLDGDIYHIWWEPSIMPRTLAAPSNFPAVEAKQYDKDVTQADIAEFFLDFMENDKLGVISIAHMVLADQLVGGVNHPDCIKCAQMASQAVDFPKSGVPVRMNELPRTTNLRPDFLAPGPGVEFVAGNPSLVVEDYDIDLELDDDYLLDLMTRVNAVDADDPFATGRKFRYYKSEKVLGKLFREIDEEKFIKSWEDNAVKYERAPNAMLKKVQEYLVRNADLQRTLDLLGFATHLRTSYETNMRDIGLNYAMSRSNEPLQEVEVFIGCIIGTESHRQSRAQREGSENMRGEVNRLVAHTVGVIKYGPDGNSAVKEGTFDGFTLERALACVMVSLTAREDDEGGSSFGWLATAIGLKELSKRKVDETLVETLAGLNFN
ncbi:hypothetical protein TWF730_003683 [Orbilia blumenaviensis]|uniref:RNA-dependent RNA polymerase n=1 Tax=Orbilia blumenaviensis TaxID=1796055 RepID=A0AAV9U613_9PEZI